MTEKTEHALLSASASHRWLNCTASVLACKDLPDNAGEAAQKGTEVHELCAYKVLTQILGKEAKRPDYFYNKIDEDNSDAYAEMIKAAYTEGDLLEVEQKVDYSNYTAPNSFGTCDCYIVHDDTLSIFDYKNGQLEVKAEKNPQMMLYALGVYDSLLFPEEIKTVKMYIVQPNAGNLSSYSMSIEELLEEAKLFKKKATEAMEGGVFKIGEWCRFCRNKANCSTYNQKKNAENVQKVAEAIQSFNTVFADVGNGTVKAFKDYTTEEINTYLLHADAMMAWLKDLKEYALNEARQGHKWQGFKLYARSTRCFSDEKKVAEILKAQGIEAYEVVQPKLKGLTIIEKEIGKKKMEELLGEYIKKVQGKETLIAE